MRESSSSDFVDVCGSEHNAISHRARLSVEIPKAQKEGVYGPSKQQWRD